MSGASANGRRVVVLGVDGLPCTLLRRLASSGVMPHCERLLAGGTLCSMTASIPEVSSTSWSTFMTGVNPGRHGIFGFMEIDPGDYSWKFPSFGDLRSRTLWDLAGERGLRSVVLNLPATYPARPLEGLLVSGFVALDLRKAVYPASLLEYLQRVGYRLDVDARAAATSMDDFTADIAATLRKRAEVIEHLFDTEPWDLFLAVVTETDRLHHYLWEALEDERHPRHPFALECYRQVDALIGAVARKLEPHTALVLLSDHGFAPVRKEVNLNVYLRQKGYLRFDPEPPRSFADLAEGSTAFALDPSRLYVHLRGRYRRGTVDAGSYEEVRSRLTRDLLALEVDGLPVVSRVLRREEVYHGPEAERAPDLVLLPREGFDLKGAVGRTELAGRGLLTGGHTHGNATLYVNRPLACGEPGIADAGATVAALLGLPTADLDGRSLV